MKSGRLINSKSIIRVFFIIGTILLISGLLLGGVTKTVQAGRLDKVTICHAAGLDTTTHYITITIGYNAAYGPAGHFDENGTPNAGHENDYLGPCGVDQ